MALAGLRAEPKNQTHYQERPLDLNTVIGSSLD